MKNVLLASLGAGNLKEATYQFNNATHKTRFCCLGLANILGIKFDYLYLLLTEEAKKACEAELCNEAAGAGFKICIIEINSGKTIDEIWQMFDQVTDCFDKSEETNIFLDISNGFRHLPLLSFASLTYLESSGKVKLAGVFYGAWEARSDGNIAPVFDLTPLINIIKGSYSVRAFEETGAVEQLGVFLNDMLLMKDKDRKALRSRLAKLNGAINSGLTIEAGIESSELDFWLKENIPHKCALKAADELIYRLKERIGRILVDGKENKRQKRLSIEELQRELNFIELQISCNRPDTALLLLREWIVNRVWLAEKHNGNWLKVKDRESIERTLGFWASSMRGTNRKEDSQTFSALAKKWDDITRERNNFAHAGFREDVVYPESANTVAVDFLRLCREQIINDSFWRLPVRETDNSKILITGMGASFGLLYSAVRLVKPDTVVVVTSTRFMKQAIEACRKAEFESTANLHIIEMQDVFCGFNEAPDIVEAIWPVIKSAGSLVVNLTGGTTAMQWVMQAIYERSRSGQLPVRRVAFVDRRPAVEQQQNPWCLGEIFEIEKNAA